jgi:tetratricopeptide (TPR) repeat protein
MKMTLSAFVFIITAVLAAAQTPAPRYRITAVDGADTALLAAELEQRFAVWNRLFCFDPARLASPLAVRLFTSPETYAAYTAARAGRPEQSASAVYLHYANPAERELAVLSDGGGDLPYQSFVQFFRAFVPNPPPWMLRGFAAYFSGLRWNAAAGKIGYRENLAWLAEARRILGNTQPDAVSGIEQVLKSAEGETQTEYMEALSWALASFFLSNVESEYFRALTDSFVILEPDASARANETAVFLRISLFTDMDALQAELAAHLAALKTADELIAAGLEALAAKKYAAAYALFEEAKEQKPSMPAPYYYLGMTAYEQKDYGDAETRYAEALERGADRALIQYARGMCAAGRGSIAEARKLLEEAAGTEGEERYRALARDLLARMR